MNTKVFSGIQPTGQLTLGNYIGALRNFAKLQNKYDECLYCIVDQHAITLPQNPNVLRSNIVSTAAAYIACGIDRSPIFQQSSVHEHTALAWVLTTIAKVGTLNRMSQFRTKAGINDADDENPQLESVGMGLFTYPILMAADILLYKSTHVPVGEDQRQHLYLARDLAKTFNSQFGVTFPVPEPIINTVGAKIMSLRYPDRKMSKSSMETEEEVIFLTDTADQIKQKIKRATTDADFLPSETEGLNGRLGAKNLLTIFAVLSDVTLDEACQIFGGKGFGALKKDLTNLLVDTIVPIGTRMAELIKDRTIIEERLDTGTEEAFFQAEANIDEVYKLVGFR